MEIGEKMINDIAEKIANEPIVQQLLEDDVEDIVVNVDQHIIDEDIVDRNIERMHDLAQWRMYDDPYMNWSGNR